MNGLTKAAEVVPLEMLVAQLGLIVGVEKNNTKVMFILPISMRGKFFFSLRKYLYWND